MKRIIALMAVLLSFPMLAHSEGSARLHREPVKFMKSAAATVGAYTVNDNFTHATGVSTVDTAQAISIRCILPKAQSVVAPVATDSSVWLRFTIERVGTGHAMAVAPTITLQTLQTPHTGAAAIVNATATAMTQGQTAYTVADTTWAKTYSHGTVALATTGLAGAWVRPIITGSIIGTYRVYVEYWTSCPQLTQGGPQ